MQKRYFAPPYENVPPYKTLPPKMIPANADGPILFSGNLTALTKNPEGLRHMPQDHVFAKFDFYNTFTHLI